jgi:uncharacterized membrane protein
MVGVASFLEVPVGHGFGAYQLNALVRVGSLAAALITLFAFRGTTLPAVPSMATGLGIGALTGVGSLLYCFSLDYLPVSLVVTFANLYIVITIVLGILVLGEPLTALKIAGIGGTLAGVLVLAHAPARFGVHREVRPGESRVHSHAYTVMGIYVVIIGVGAFLEKPALRGLDATQLNALVAIGMTAVAGVAFALKGPSLPMTKHTLAGIGVGGMIGVASVFYFLGLRTLPVSVAAAAANTYVVVTVLLSAIVLRQPLTRARGGAIVLTLLGVTLLAISAG